METNLAAKSGNVNPIDRKTVPEVAERPIMKELKITGFRTAPEDLTLDPQKRYAWFTFDAEGYFEPAVLGEEMTIEKFPTDLPKDIPLVLVIVADSGKQVALVAYSFISVANHPKHGSLYKFSGYFSREKIGIPEERILKVYKPVFWMMDNREPEPVPVAIVI